MRPILFAAALAAGFAVTAPGFVATARAAETKPEDLLKAREGMFQAIKLQFGPLLAVAKGEAAISPDTALRAENLAALAKVMPSLFAKGGESLPNSKARPEAFVRPEFLRYFETLAAEAGKVAAAARANDLEGVKAGIAAAGKTCKGCHDVFMRD